jgi:cysteine desulfurase
MNTKTRFGADFWDQTKRHPFRRLQSMIYLDHNATTGVAPCVLEEMMPVFGTDFANPANTFHIAGRRAADCVDLARNRVAGQFGGSPSRVIFTSGSTEALNLAIKGLSLSGSRNRILVGATEHKAVLEAAIARRDAIVEMIPVRQDGTIDLDVLSQMLGEDVALMSLMAANNETGTLHPVNAAFNLASQCGALTLCDATQAVGRIKISEFNCADFISLSAHKIYGPKGVGCLVATREGFSSLSPIIDGGGQERGLRSGTINVPGVVGLGAAVELVCGEFETEVVRLRSLRDRLFRGLEDRISDVVLNGHEVQRLCNTVNVRFVGADGEAVLANLQRVAASTGSACQSAVPAPSHVLTAMGLSRVAADESLRFSLGRTTTEIEIDLAIEDIATAVNRVRTLLGS